MRRAAVVVLAITFGCTQIDAGETGVQTVFGEVQEGTLTPGFHFIRPWSDVHVYNVRTQEMKETVQVPTSEGLSVSMDVSVLYHVDPQKAQSIYASLGTEERYRENYVLPTVRNAIRDAVVAYKAEDLYTTKREAVAEDIRRDVGTKFTGRGFVMEDVLIRDLDLPEGLANSIETKMEEEQRALQMQFTLAHAQQEAERKRVEAEGIRDANQTIAAGLTTNYLSWYYIETLRELVGSPNNTTIVMPTDQSLTPLLNVR